MYMYHVAQARGQALQQNAAADSASQTSLSIDAVLARIETRLRSLEEQLSQIENKVSNLHMVSRAAVTACTIASTSPTKILRHLILLWGHS